MDSDLKVVSPLKLNLNSALNFANDFITKDYLYDDVVQSFKGHYDQLSQEIESSNRESSNSDKQFILEQCNKGKEVWNSCIKDPLLIDYESDEDHESNNFIKDELSSPITSPIPKKRSKVIPSIRDTIAASRQIENIPETTEKLDKITVITSYIHKSIKEKRPPARTYLPINFNIQFQHRKDNNVLRFYPRPKISEEEMKIFHKKLDTLYENRVHGKSEVPMLPGLYTKQLLIALVNRMYKDMSSKERYTSGTSLSATHSINTQVRTRSYRLRRPSSSSAGDHSTSPASDECRENLSIDALNDIFCAISYFFPWHGKPSEIAEKYITMSRPSSIICDITPCIDRNLDTHVPLADAVNSFTHLQCTRCTMICCVRHSQGDEGIIQNLNRRDKRRTTIKCVNANQCSKARYEREALQVRSIHGESDTSDVSSQYSRSCLSTSSTSKLRRKTKRNKRKVNSTWEISSEDEYVTAPSPSSSNKIAKKTRNSNSTCNALLPNTSSQLYSIDGVASWLQKNQLDVREEIDNETNESCHASRLGHSTPCTSDHGKDDEWKESDKLMARISCLMFPSTPCARPLMLNHTKTCMQIDDFVRSDKELQEYRKEQRLKSSEQETSTSPTSPSLLTSNGSKKKKVVTLSSKGISTCQLQKHYRPCQCQKSCNVHEGCLCATNGTKCEIWCSCNKLCTLRFEGCRCKQGSCSKNSCPCFIALRECDARVCKHCNLDERQPSYSVCTNNQIARRMWKKVAIGVSDVAGYGAFLAEEMVSRGELVSEYCGELIKHEEANRRGVIYDTCYKTSYLFDLDDELVVDAMKFGNLIRFANHSANNPNCSARIVNVCGERHIGIYANREIKQGEELFFDYGYGENHKMEFVSIERPIPSNGNIEKIAKKNQSRGDTSVLGDKNDDSNEQDESPSRDIIVAEDDRAHSTCEDEESVGPHPFDVKMRKLFGLESELLFDYDPVAPHSGEKKKTCKPKALIKQFYSSPNTSNMSNRVGGVNSRRVVRDERMEKIRRPAPPPHFK